MLIAKSLAHQLGSMLPPVAVRLLALSKAEIDGLQRSEDAIRMLLLEPLAALPPDSVQPVLVFDALDEADAPKNPSALANPVLRFVLSMHAAAVPIFVTTRPKPNHITVSLRARWGDALTKWEPRNLREDVPTGGLDYLPAAKRHAVEDILLASEDVTASKIFRVVLLAALPHLRDGAALPASLPEAYAAFFEATMPRDATAAKAVTKLLRVLVASRVPPTVATLKAMGLGGAWIALPGSLFKVHRCSHPRVHRSLCDESPRALLYIPAFYHEACRIAVF